MIEGVLLLALFSAPGTATVSGRVTLGGLRPAGDAVWVTRGGGCPLTIPDDRIVATADGSLQDALVMLFPLSPAASAASSAAGKGAAAEVRAVYCDLAPRVQAVAPGTLLGVRAEPGSGHRLHAYREGRSLWGGALEPGKLRALPEPAVIDVRCDAGHEWEVAWIYVTEAPFHGVTGGGGRFELKGVPGGRYRLRAWHPYLGQIEAPVTVDPAAPSGLTVSFHGREAVEAMYPGNTVEVTR